MNTNALISFTVTAKLICVGICVFVFASTKCWFSHNMAQILQSLVFFDKESKFIVIFHDCAARFVPLAWSETLMKGFLATRPIYSRGFRYCQLVTSLSLEISIYKKNKPAQLRALESATLFFVT